MDSETEVRELVVVVWEDAHAESSSGWMHESEITTDAYVVTSVGILLPAETKPGHVSICQSYAYGFVDTILHVPCAMVKEITTTGVIKPEQG